jgi:predicted outer membrane protein
MQQIGGHLAALTAFQTEADNGTDPQLKALARKWLPSIQAHFELAVDLTQHVGGASSFKSH